MSANPFSLEGKTVCVTGASSGIGRQIAISCSEMGARVVATGRDQARLDETLGLMTGEGHVAVSADLLADGAVRQVVEAAGPVDGLVHSAGISRLAPVRMLNASMLREVTSINFDAPMLLTQGFLSKNAVRDGGSIVFVSSIAAHIGVAGVGIYSGTKAALIAAMRCLAMEVVKRRIRANCVSPALVETPLLEAAGKMMSSMDKERGNYPLGFGKPTDVANAVVFLLSDASRWITGTSMILDGGLTIG